MYSSRPGAWAEATARQRRRRPERLGLAVLAAALAACARGTPAAPPPPTPPAPTRPAAAQPYDPQPGDTAWLRDLAYLDSARLVVRASQPPQVSLVVSGSLPTPCHQLRARAAAPDPDSRIRVDVYSVVDPSLICAQMLAGFEAAIALADPPPGSYTVWANGQLAGDFTR